MDDKALLDGPLPPMALSKYGFRYDPVSGLSYSYIMYARGVNYMQKKDYTKALRCLKLAGRDSPHYKTFQNIGVCYLNLGRPALAIQPLAAATALNRQARAPMLCAKAFKLLNDKSSALEFAKEAHRRDPNWKLLQQLVHEISEMPDP